MTPQFDQRRRDLFKICLAAAASAVVTACGGGGSSSNTVAAPVDSATVEPPIETSAPSIIQHPADEHVTMGQDAFFSIVATGIAPLTYQWTRNGVMISGATTDILRLPQVTIAENGDSIAATVSNAFGQTFSNTAVLNVVVKQLSIDTTHVYVDSREVTVDAMHEN